MGDPGMENNFTKYTQIAEMLKVLAHPVRLCIVKGLLDAGECNVTYMQECLYPSVYCISAFTETEICWNCGRQ
jgi:hypothetical protein